jgi:hypothetical protein
MISRKDSTAVFRSTYGIIDKVGQPPGICSPLSKLVAVWQPHGKEVLR